jgi:hypothetical protein
MPQTWSAVSIEIFSKEDYALRHCTFTHTS